MRAPRRAAAGPRARLAEISLMAASKTRVAVLFGGRSSEHDVSIQSGAAVIAALDASRFDAVPVAIDRSGRWLDPGSSAALLPPDAAAKCRLDAVTVSHEPGRSAGFDMAFPALHGPHGEDGRLQGLLDLGEVPYVGSGVLGSACGMDKDFMKRLFREAGLPTLPHVTLTDSGAAGRAAEAVAGFPYPVFVKPANLGSSVGISKAAGPAELERAVRLAWEFDRKVIVEPAVEAREIECAVLGNDDPIASLAGEIVVPQGFYDYKTKYLTDAAELVVPARLADSQARAIHRMAVAAFRAVGCSGLARVDCFLERGTGRILLNEVNTMPGFTRVSMFPRLWMASGLTYPDLISRLIELAFERHRSSRKLRVDLA